MVYRKAKQKVRRVYSRGKSLFGGDLFKNPIITAIGLFGIVDPPDDAEKKEEYTEYSNVGENQEQSEYSNVGETQETAKKRFAY